MEKVNNGRIASWIALICGIFSFVCVSGLGLSMIHPASEFSPLGTLQVLFLLLTVQAAPLTVAAAAAFGIPALIRSRAVPGRIRRRARIGIAFAGLALLLLALIYLWARASVEYA